jgi:hypothetical protein
VSLHKKYNPGSYNVPIHKQENIAGKKIGMSKYMERRPIVTAKRVLIGCLAVAIMVFVGCTPSVISTDAGVFLNGTLYASSGQNLDSVYTATLQAMDRLQIQVTDKAKDVFGAKVIAKSTDGKVISVKMEPTAQMRTKYTIHISGLFGNKERSQKIFDGIVHALEMPKGS